MENAKEIGHVPSSWAKLRVEPCDPDPPTGMGESCGVEQPRRYEIGLGEKNEDKINTAKTSKTTSSIMTILPFKKKMIGFQTVYSLNSPLKVNFKVILSVLQIKSSSVLLHLVLPCSTATADEKQSAQTKGCKTSPDFVTC